MHNLNQLHDLLILIDRLELQIYNSAVGTALGRLPQAPRASIVFFRTNRKVCDDWFFRIRSSIVKGSKIIGHDAMAIRHGLLVNSLMNFKLFSLDIPNCMFKFNIGLL